MAEEFLLQYYGDQMAIPPQIIVQEDVEEREALAEALGQRRGGQGRGPRRRARRQAPDPRAGRAQRAAGARPGAPEGRAPPPAARRGARRAPGGARARRAAAAHRVLRHLQPDGHPHGRVDGRLRGRRAEEVRLPALQRARAARRACPTTSPRWRRCSARRLAQWETQQDLSPHDPKRNESFATLPNLDRHRRRPGAARRRACARCDGFRERGVTVISLAKRIEEVFVPGRREPIVLAARHARAAAAAARARRGPPLRDHPPPHAPRPRDDDLDPRRPAGDRPGAQAHADDALRLARGGARPRRASSSRRCPGLPGKTAREIWTHLHRTGD